MKKVFFVFCIDMKLRWYHRSLLLLILGGVFFGDLTFAQTTPIIPGIMEDGIRVGYDKGGLQGFTEFAEQGLKVIYLIFWPMLAVAAAAMDNSLVYGGAFHLTGPLFKFRQIIRTFANYTIGLYFVGSILAAFFGNKLENVFSGLIKNVALAAILVNMSWWMIAALVDLSTLATFSLGALPLHALKNDAVFKNNVYYMKTYNNLNINASTSNKADKYDFSMMYGCTQGEGDSSETRYYLPCAIDDGKLFYKGSNNEPLKWEQYKQDFINVRKSDTNINTDDISDAYCVYDKQLIRNDYGTDMHDCKEAQRLMIDGREEGIIFCASVDDIVTKAVNNSGPLQTIFSSILNMSELATTTNTGSIKEVGLSLLIKLVFGIALIIPLIALAVVMIVRVVYLWLIIVFSPLITIIVALQWGDTVDNKIEGMLKNIFKPTQIVSLIFLPVIATFGLSISIIFLSLLRNLPLIESDVGRAENAQEQPDGCYNDIGSALGLERDQTPEGVSYNMDITELNFTKWLRETGADIGNMMSWLIINFFGIALMWMVVFATLKTNEFTAGIAKTIEDTSKDRMGTIPLPLAGGIGLSTLQKTPDLVKQKIVGDKLEQQQQLLDEFAMGYDPETKELNKKFQEAQQNPGTLGGLNEVSLARNTDFVSDYQAGANAYAQKAKSYYYDDKTKKLNTAGEAYAKANGRVDSAGNVNHAKAIENINNSLDNVDGWDDALSNKEFVNRMHTEDGGNGYDNFLGKRDQRIHKTNSTVNVLESGLKKISGTSATGLENHGAKKVGNDTIHWYLYDNDTKFTTFRWNSADNQYKGGNPTTLKIDNAIDTNHITDVHITTYNQMLLLGDRQRFSELGFFKAFNNEDTITTTSGKKYTANRDTDGSILSYDVSTPPTPTTSQ